MMPTAYNGARFLKCDLQMQTPADKAHWQGKKLDVSASLKEVAETYIKRCYDVGLEIIAITDHNFASKDFLPYLRDAAKALAGEYELIIFPGFEFTANVGKGVHVLALFEPDKDLNEIDHALTQCGVPTPRQDTNGAHKPSKKSLTEILDIVQNHHGGLVIIPHIQSNDGLFDNEKISEWLQAEEYQNPDLLAVEIPKSVEKMSDGFQKLFRNGDDCDPTWKRVRPVAKLMSSDCKALEQADGVTNFIGCRYTWIRMSTPSIESLRQAFLDEKSRMRVSDGFEQCPDDNISHPYIASVKISGADFLSDTEIEFSPHLNALIGGRGTGKSTILEYLRIALARENEVHNSLADDFFSLRETIEESGDVEVRYNKGADFDDPEYCLRSVRADAPMVTPETNVGSIEKYFPVQIFSRGQIEAIANDPDRQRSILDDLNSAELQKLTGVENELVSRLNTMNAELRRVPELKKENADLIATIAELEAKIKKVRAKAKALDGWSSWLHERRAISSGFVGFEGQLQALEQLSHSLPLALDEYDQDTTHGPLVKKKQKEIEALSTELKSGIAELKNDFQQKASLLKSDSDFKSWEEALGEAEGEYEAALESLEADGVDPDQHKRNLELLQEHKDRLGHVQTALNKIEEMRSSIRDLVTTELMAIWQQQFAVREKSAKTLNDSVPETANGLPTVHCKVVMHGDRRAFIKQMKHIQQDKRKVSESDWHTILDAAFATAQANSQNPILVIEDWIAQYKKGESTIPSFPSDVALKKLEAIAEWMPEEIINKCLFQRIPDAVSISLHRREDGKKVGELAGRILSAGQKSTTVLSLILAAGSEPILIDQPEDDLDNEFVYDQLVPVLRTRKEARQIIVVSHNANIPVNGDAELIVPLEVSNSRGCTKVSDGKLAVGALDKPETRDAVELILEGSADAFRRRHEKYGF